MGETGARSLWGRARARAWSSGLASLSVSAIEPDPGQPRRHFDEAALDEAASIAARG
jgi:ParB family chromosome partitioning protein